MADSSRASTRTASTTAQPEQSNKENASTIALDNKSSPDPFLVQFDEGDSANPKNWSFAKKWYLTLAGGLLVLNATFSSSAPSALVPTFMEEFGISQEVGTLTVSLFVCGYCVGPLVWGPLSEQYGRRPIFIISFFIYMCFQIGCALSQNITSILIFRFLGGTFAAAPLANSGALISDIWDARGRGTALAVFTVAPFAGPGIGPVVSGYLILAGVSWHWLFWILTIFASPAGVCWLQIVFTIPETYSPVLLAKKAKEMRKRTGDERYHAAIESQNMTLSQRVETILARPFKVLFREPMLIAITLYMSFVYGCIYLLFEAYPVVFTKGHNLDAGVSGLVFLPLPIGGFIAVATYILFLNPDYERKAQECAPNPVPPEFRLRVAMISAPFFAISFFWFAWTSFPSISMWAPMMSGALLGWSICLIFLALFNYIIDAYLAIAASALAASTVVRSLFGAGFPLFATQMYDRLGPEWASTLLGFIALIMMPIPFVLSRYGPILRFKSKYAPSGPLPSSSPA
ncbi:major facilitator superfamily domain-containing protein [Suillus subaureus]|uniref:Major facilitator superfamily domain-containing protein n=1 Tax=Suillus subaureus TaxID=48587 RepID=A0A9P7JJA2_9AGAM|nr:major facilitator superfamily domain-containing protein [Suillus subaureus]KAG1825807.1 major facilitator superfamily domain-containing protein [Suillus subaureus]